MRPRGGVTVGDLPPSLTCRCRNCKMQLQPSFAGVRTFTMRVRRTRTDGPDACASRSVFLRALRGCVVRLQPTAAGREARQCLPKAFDSPNNLKNQENTKWKGGISGSFRRQNPPEDANELDHGTLRPAVLRSRCRTGCPGSHRPSPPRPRSRRHCQRRRRAVRRADSVRSPRPG
jgi:hypothetical protein